MSAPIRQLSLSQIPVFLLNSRLGLCSAASFEAPLLPKLRGHFAEFLNKGSPVRLRILSSPTCVGFRYGYLTDKLAAFLASVNSLASLLYFGPHHGSPERDAYFTTSQAYRLDRVDHHPARAILLCHCLIPRRCRNIHLLSIAYDFCPRLRPRLTLGG